MKHPLLLVGISAAIGFCACALLPFGARADALSQPFRLAPAIPDGTPVRLARSRTLPFQKLVRGNPAIKTIALTFDDGPHAGYTDQVLAILALHRVKATFFLIGRNVEKCPDIARQIVSEGHEIANHTQSHIRLTALGESEILGQILQGSRAIEQVTGVEPRFFRPPGGEYDDRVLEIAHAIGLTTALWTADGADFTTSAGNPPPERIVKKILQRASPGGIIILHDPMPSSLIALPEIIEELRAEGYRFVTCSELADTEGVITFGGPRLTGKPWPQGPLPSKLAPPAQVHSNADEDSTKGA